MKNTFATLFVFGMMSYAMTPSYGQDLTNRVEQAESSFKDALLLVKPSEDAYRLGAPMLMFVTVTNISQMDIGLLDNRSADDYRVSVFSTNGTVVQSPATVSSDRSRSNGMVSHIQLTIKPGQSASKNVDLAKLTHIEAEGTYYITLARRFDSGFIVSDKVKINVVK